MRPPVGREPPVASSSLVSFPFASPGDPYDEDLVERVAAGVVADVAIRGRRLQITVQNGVVILEGCVESAAAREAAGRRAWATPGVHDVCNMLATDAGSDGSRTD